VHPDGESIVRRYSPPHEEVFAPERLHVLSLVQEESFECRVRHPHLEIDSIDLGISERGEIEVELREPECARHLELYFLAQLAPERIQRGLARFHCAAEAAPVPRIEYPRLAVAQLHDVAAVLVDQQRGHGVVGAWRLPVGGEEMLRAKAPAFDALPVFLRLR